MKAELEGLANTAVVVEKSAIPPPVVSFVGGRNWRLEAEYRYADGETTITVLKGFEFDLSSVPRPLWILIAPFELSVTAPLLHDFLYHYGGNPPLGAIAPPRSYTRAETDGLFVRVMEQEGVAAWRRGPAFAAVRIFGVFAWRKDRMARAAVA